MEAKLQKLKVTELKELLAKHHLTQTGKKDDLVKRLLDNGIAVDDDGNEELGNLEPPADTTAPASTAPAEASTSAPAKPPASAADSTDLTPEQQAMKARAERFGIPFNPNPTPRTNAAPKPAPTSSTSTAQTPTSAPAAKAEKPGAIDKAPVGVSEETLARRAAKFGIPEKKAAPAETNGAAAKPVPAAEPAELSPEVKARIAEEEEKKRRRAEKFGTGKPAETNGEPDAKKVKV